jgi:hypothetical protein
MKQTAPPFHRLWPYAVLGLIVLASVLGNLYWLQQNVVQLGHDASAHLSRTLKMAQEMSQPSLAHFLRGLTITEFRPPGLYLAAQPFYWLFGRSIDSAQLANVAIMALILICTFVLARHVLGGATSSAGAAALALLATALTALLPMLLAMSRLFYAETLVTLCVVAGVYFLLKSEGFARRSWCLGLGAALGVGMLAKWTLPVYMAAPILLVVWQSSLHRSPAQRSFVAWRSVAGRSARAALAASVVVLLLYWSQQALWAQTLLGGWLAPAWFVVWFAVFGLLLSPSKPLLNLLLALAIGAAIAGLWYFPRAGFAFELSDVAFGTGGGDFDAADWSSSNQYFRYSRLFFQHHTGLAIGLLLLPAGLLSWLWCGRTWLRELPGALLIWVVTLSPFVLLIVTSQTNSRNLVPILPLFAILVCMGLLAYPIRWRYAVATVWLAILLLFWSLSTFDGLNGLRSQTSILWPTQSYTVAPASGVSDPGYWIVPEVLAQIDASSAQTTTLGVLLDTAPLHGGSFEYPILVEERAIDLTSLAGPRLKGIPDILRNQYILTKDGDNREMAAPAQAMAAQLLAGAPWFQALYGLMSVYSLPNGETAFLYRRSEGPPDPYQFSTIVGADLPVVAGAVRDWWSPGATLAFATPETAVWLGTQDVPLAQAIIPGPGTELQPGQLADVQKTLIVATRYRTSEFQEWLGRRFRYITEVQGGEFTATLYGRVDRPLEPIAVDAAWPALSVTSLATRPEIARGDPLPLDFTLAGQLDGTWKISARLVDRAGAVIWQQDTAAVPGELALTLFVPPNASPGEYTLHFVVYNAATQEAAVDVAGQPATPLATIKVLE